MNTRRLARVLLLSVTVLLPAAATAAEGPRPGRWEYRVTMQIPGMPALPPDVQLPPGVTMPQMGPQGMTTTFQQCVTAKDLVPQSKDESQDCKVTRQEVKGNTVRWAATCNTPDGPAEGEGTVTYSGDSMRGNFRFRGRDEDGESFELDQQMTGRYLGPCS